MKVFVGMDGDDVGVRLISLVIQNQAAEAARFSDRIISALQLVGDRIQQAGGTVLFIGGDNLMAEMEFDRGLLRELQALFRSETGCGMTIGVGRLPVEAYLALKLGKGDGKGQIVCFAEPRSADQSATWAQTLRSLLGKAPTGQLDSSPLAD